MPRRQINIIELAMVAVRRQNFSTPFRYLDKMTVCVRPRYVISCGASELTGLHNEELEIHQQFSDLAVLVRQFLSLLPKPACLLAHNGNRFDFPLFRAELLRALGSDFAAGVFCCDTLPALKHIISTGLIDVDIKREQAELSKLDDTFWTAFEGCNILDDDDVIAAPHVTPPRHPKTQAINAIPSKKMKREEVCASGTRQNGVRRSLFGKEATSSAEPSDGKWTCNGTGDVAQPTPKKPRQGYSLADLYDLFFKEPVPLAHSADADCLALAKVCHHVKDAFLEYVDDHYVPLENVTPMW